MAAGVFIDDASHKQSAAERLHPGLYRLHVDHLDLRLREQHDSRRGVINAFVALINRDKLHATDGAPARLVALDPGVHRALVEENLALA